MNIGVLKELLLSAEWQEIQELLDKTIDAKILWVVTESGTSILKFDENHHELCQLIRDSDEGSKRCQNSQQTRFREVKRTHQTIFSPCYCGLMNFAVPIMIDGKLISVIGGQLSRSEFPLTVERCAQISVACGLDVKDVIAQAKGIKHISKSDQRNIMSQLSLFSGMLSFLVKYIERQHPA
jgi:ligand-binding sensor protein